MTRVRNTSHTAAQLLMQKTAAKTTKILKRELKGTAPYDPDNIKYVVDMLRKLNVATSSLAEAADVLGSISAHEISPDGLLGGRGYVMAVKDIRNDITSAENIVSALTDTLSDELTNPKWELTPDQIAKYKEEAKSPAADTAQEEAETPIEPPAEEPAPAPEEEVPSFFGEEAPESTTPVETPATPGVPGDVLPDAPVAEETPAPGEPAPEGPAAPELPYKKLAALVGHPERDYVARALRAPILFNLLDGHTAGN